jgi:hypothetical protein
MRVSALLQEWVAPVAEQLNPTTVWILVCDHIKHIIASIGPHSKCQIDYKSEQWKLLTEVFRLNLKTAVEATQVEHKPYGQWISKVSKTPPNR